MDILCCDDFEGGDNNPKIKTNNCHDDSICI